jgi:hypothetical protein
MAVWHITTVSQFLTSNLSKRTNGFGNFTKLSPHGFFLAEMFTAPAMEAGN